MTCPEERMVSNDEGKLPEGTRIETPRLRVRGAKEIMRFYDGILGLDISEANAGTYEVRERNAATARSDGEPLLELVVDESARPPSPSTAGLYHIALRVASERELADTIISIHRSGYGLDGFADHIVSRSAYLYDPEGNGYEVYCDMPETDWREDRDGMVQMGTLPLDLEALLSHRSNAVTGPFPGGVSVGHVHLKVTDLTRSIEFYRYVLGFSVRNDMTYLGAAFLAAGRYHHHIGLNTWQSRNGAARTDTDSGLIGFSVRVPEGAQRDAVVNKAIASGGIFEGRELRITDPDGIHVYND